MNYVLQEGDAQLGLCRQDEQSGSVIAAESTTTSEMFMEEKLSDINAAILRQCHRISFRPTRLEE